MVLGLILAAMIVLGALACATRGALRREAARGPRNAEGVMQVAAAYALDPPAEWFARHPDAGGRAPEAMLLIHGFLGGPSEYNQLPAALAAQGYHVRMMRLPGHGTRPEDFQNQNPETLLAAVRDEIAALRAEYPRVTVGGFSMGGALATLMAGEGRTDRLMLFVPYYGVTYRWYYGLRPETWNALLCPVVPYAIKSKRFVQVNRREVAGEIFTYGVVPTQGVKTLVELGCRARDPELLARIRCPVLMMAAEGDVASSPRWCRQVFDQIGSLDKQAFWFGRNINHQIFWDWEADRAVQGVLDFVGEAGAPPRAPALAG